jgi:hypothetical protein
MRRALNIATVIRIVDCCCVIVLLAISFALSGCATPSDHAAVVATSAGLKRELIPAHGFVVTAFSRITRRDSSIAIYIEGDGRAWHSRTAPADNPTPHRALGLLLAAKDPSDNVVYLARPCQLTPMKLNPQCDSRYWTHARFAEEMVSVMNDAISFYVHDSNMRIHLVGYSGGGAIAVLVAARRDDVASLRTVAGNLDHAAVNRINRVSMMPESLNAMDAALNVASIPQIHFSGSDDSTVLPSIAKEFAHAVGSCATLHVIAGLTHEGSWEMLWPRLLSITPSCAIDASVQQQSKLRQ